jgi:nucleotide-binding universal stress UspA family protein
VDGSVHANRAAEYAACFASEFDACEVILLHAQPAESYPVATKEDEELLLEPFDLGRKASATARSLLDAAKVTYHVRTELSDPAEAIAQLVVGEHVDEIIMGSRGLGRWEGLIMGSVAYRVIHNAVIPVTVVRSQSTGAGATRRDAHRLLVAVDGSPASLRAVSYVCALREAGVPVEAELLNVVAPLPEGFAAGALTGDGIDRYYRERAHGVLSNVTETLRAAHVPCTVHVASGRAPDHINDLSRKLECGRIVMGTRGHGTLASLLLGSTAYQVIHVAAAPVTLVR